MKNIFFIVCVPLLLFHSHASAQAALEVKGQPFNDIAHTEVEGHPFLENDWLNGSVLLDNRNVAAKLKFNVYQNQLLYQDKNGQALELKNKFNRFTLINADSAISNINPIVFVRGYPANNRQTDSSFYQLIADGPVQLLKFYKKTINEDRDYYSSVVTSSYKVSRMYYVFKNNRLKEIWPNKKTLLKLFEDHGDAMDTYFKNNNVDFRSDLDLQKIFAWYNSLK